MDNPDLVLRCVKSILQNILSYSHSPMYKGEKVGYASSEFPLVVINLIDDENLDDSCEVASIARQSEKYLSELWAGVDSASFIRDRIHFIYTPKNSTYYKDLVTEEIKKHSTLEPNVYDYFCLNSRKRGSQNFGNLFALAICNTFGFHPSQASVMHLDMDEMFKSLVKYRIDGKTYYQMEPGPDYIGITKKFLDMGYKVLGRKYTGNSASPINMVKELFATLEYALPESPSNYKSTKPLRSFFVLEDDSLESFKYTFVEPDELWDYIPQIIRSYKDRTPITNLRDLDWYNDRDFRLDDSTPPTQKTFRLDIVRNAFDPIKGGMHDLFNYFVLKGTLKGERVFCRIPPTLHLRKNGHGQNFQGEGLFDSIDPDMITDTYELLLFDEKQFDDRFLQDTVLSTKKAMVDFSSDSLLSRFYDIIEIHSRIQSKLSNLVMYKKIDNIEGKYFGKAKIAQWCDQSKSLDAVSNVVAEFNDFKDTIAAKLYREDSLVLESGNWIKEYFERLQDWGVLCDIFSRIELRK